jgi:ketosteroid isomerase-like protein
MLARGVGTGRASGLRTDVHLAAVFHVRGEKVTRLVFYWDREHALADLGLARGGEVPDREP